MSRTEAIKRLTARWNEQVERFPMMRRDIPLAVYLEQNLPHVLSGNLLASYHS